MGLRKYCSACRFNFSAVTLVFSTWVGVNKQAQLQRPQSNNRQRPLLQSPLGFNDIVLPNLS